MKSGSLLFLALAAAASGSAASAQTISFAELEGKHIDAVVVQNRVVQNAEGQTGPNRTTFKYSFDLMPKAHVRLVLTQTVTKLKTGETFTRSFPSDAALDHPFKYRDGMAVWTYQNDSLVRLRTQQQGGIMLTIAFTRTPAGLSCKLTNPLAREEGVGSLSSASGVGSAHIKILSVREVSSSCRVASR